MLNIFNVLLDSSDAARVSLDFSCKFNSGSFFSLQDISHLSKLNFSLSLESIGLGLSVSVDGDATLLLSKLLGHGTNLILQTTKGSLKLSSLVKSSLILTIGVIGLLFKKSEFFLWVGKTNKSSGLLDNDGPSPVSHLQILSEVSLSNLNKLSLISLLSINSSSNSLEDLSLDE